MRLITLALISLLTLLGCALSAQVDLLPERFAFEKDLNYRSDIQSPADFLGYQLGEHLTVYARVEAYARYLASQSDRVQLHQYGTTYERNPLLTLIITRPDRLQDIEAVRQRHLALLDVVNQPANQQEQAIAEEPVVLSMSYNIHGNETSSTEAAMQVAYRLAAGNDATTQRILDGAITVLYLCINPDGRDRYVYWYNSVQRALPAVDPHDMEHYEPWPAGRTNHYWFDLNRDWIWGVHPESRGHAAEYQRWMPQVHVDYHEQGYNANYFTVPGARPRNLLLPDRYEAWADTFGRANVAEFESRAISYFTRDRFDFFYPGYGSSYPSVMGAIGMLTEQGGIGGGRAVETDDGYVLTLRQRIFDHYTTSIATLHKGAEHRTALLRYSLAAWNSGTNKEPTQTYYFSDSGSGYAQEVADILHRHGVVVQRTAESTSLSDAVDYRTGRRSTQQLPAGTYVVNANQPRHLFIHTLLARNLAIEDSVMYDMATWSAPLAYNLNAYSSQQGIRVRTLPAISADAAGTTPTLLPPDAYAYVIDWQQRHAPRALAMLWERGYRVRSAVEPFTQGGESFSAGSLIILRGRNLERAEKLTQDLREIGQATKVGIAPLSSGLADTGYDLASARNQPLKMPRVALLVDPPFSMYTAGQVFFLFDQETRLPVTRIRANVLSELALPKFGERYGYVSLYDYDVLILAGGRSLDDLFGQREQAVLRAWIQQGGTLIAMEEAAEFFTQSTRFNKQELLSERKDSSEEARSIAYADREQYYGKQEVPGSALRARLDVTHPLAFGMDATVYALKFGDQALVSSADLQSVGTYSREVSDLLVAGYAPRASLDRVAGRTFAGVLPLGQGQIVYLLDNPHYRMFWRGTSRLMQNAVMQVPGY